MADLRVNVAGVEFQNPLIAASGTFGFGHEYNEFYPLSASGDNHFAHLMFPVKSWGAALPRTPLLLYLFPRRLSRKNEPWESKISARLVCFSIGSLGR